MNYLSRRAAAAAVLASFAVAGCFAAAPAPTGDPTRLPAARTVAPAASTAAPSASIRPAASPSPSPDVSAERAAEVVRAFVADFADAQPPFRIAMRGRAVVTEGLQQMTVLVEGSGDVVGDNFRGSLSMASPESRLEVELVIKRGKGYVRTAGDRWLRVDDFEQTQPLNPFTGLRRRDMTHLGLVQRSGRRLHHLQTQRWVGEDPEESMPRLRQSRIESVRFDVFVDDAGVPVDADLVFELSGTLEGHQMHASYEVFYAFTEVGKPKKIKAPIR